MSLTVENLTVHYATHHHEYAHASVVALDGVSLTIEKGKITTLIGESGSGKTTVAKSLLGLLPPEATFTGRITLERQELSLRDETAMNAIRWKKVALVFQNVFNQFHPLYTIGEQIKEPLKTNGVDEETAEKRLTELFTFLHLSHDVALRHRHEVSGGELTRAALAMALISNPDYLILDEPTASLDASSKDFILRFITRLAKEGKGILLITHDLEKTAAIATQTLVLYLGSVFEELQGPVSTTPHRHPYTRALLRTVPALNMGHDLSAIRGEPIFRVIRNDGTHSHAHTFAHEHVPSSGCLFKERCTQACDKCAQGKVELAGTIGQRLRCARGGIVTAFGAQNIRKEFPGFCLDVNRLALPAGETFALVGASGSGKSTLAQILAGLLEPTTGCVYLENQELKTNKDFLGVAGKIGYVSQNPYAAVNPRWSVFDCVVEPLKILSPQKQNLEEEVLEALRLVHLPTDEAFLHKAAVELNAGALQRLCIARALITHPTVLIADEPTSALDPSVQAKVLKTLFELQNEKGLTLFLITHDLAIARKFADTVGVMASGRLVEVAKAATLFEKPEETASKELLAART